MFSWLAGKRAKKQACLPVKQQLQTYTGRFGSLLKNNDSEYNLELAVRSSSINIAAVDNLKKTASTTNADKLEQIRAVHARWKDKNKAVEKTPDGPALLHA